MYKITKNGKTSNEKSWRIMKLVLLFFCGILIFLIFLVALLVLSKIRLNVKECYISNIEENGEKKKLEKDILIYVEIYLIGLIKIARIKITKGLIQKLKIEDDFKSIKKDVKIMKRVHPIEVIKRLKPKIKQIDLKLLIGTYDVTLTAFLVAIISTAIRNTFEKRKS